MRKTIIKINKEKFIKDFGFQKIKVYKFLCIGDLIMDEFQQETHKLFQNRHSHNGGLYNRFGICNEPLDKPNDETNNYLYILSDNYNILKQKFDKMDWDNFESNDLIVSNIIYKTTFTNNSPYTGKTIYYDNKYEKISKKRSNRFGYGRLLNDNYVSIPTQFYKVEIQQLFNHIEKSNKYKFV